jgi:hypothetical protein
LIDSIEHIPYEKRYLEVGSMVSRLTESDSFNLWGLIHCQHFDVVIDVDNEPLIVHITTEGVAIITLSEYMGQAKMLHVYHSNPYPDLSNIDKRKYSILMSNWSLWNGCLSLTEMYQTISYLNLNIIYIGDITYSTPIYIFSHTKERVLTFRSYWHSSSNIDDAISTMLPISTLTSFGICCTI